MKVRDLMVRDVATLWPGNTLDTAVELMRDRECGSVVVSDERSRVLGMLTDRDVCLSAFELGKPLSQIRVELAMSRPVHTCAVQDSLEAAEGSMGQHQVRRLPVVDEGGRLAGLISLDDIARKFSSRDGLLGNSRGKEAVGRTLGEIGRPHLVDGTGER